MNMKKRLLTVIRSSYQPMPDGLLIDEDALSKVENPGPQGKRQTHLVNSFSCDGKEWVQL